MLVTGYPISGNRLHMYQLQYLALIPALQYHFKHPKTIPIPTTVHITTRETMQQQLVAFLH